MKAAPAGARSVANHRVAGMLHGPKYGRLEDSGTGKRDTCVCGMPNLPGQG